MYLTIILLSCIFAILTIVLLKIEKLNVQIGCFTAVLLFFIIFYYLCKFFYSDSKSNNILNLEAEDNYFPEEELDLDLDLENKLENNIIENDQIIPPQSYNKDDCTNDNSCLIKPDNYNLFPENKNKSDVNGTLLPKDHCKTCGRILSLINKRVEEDFDKNPYDISYKSELFNLTKLEDNQNVCIHCKQFSLI